MHALKFFAQIKNKYFIFNAYKKNFLGHPRGLSIGGWTTLRIVSVVKLDCFTRRAACCVLAQDDSGERSISAQTRRTSIDNRPSSTRTMTGIYSVVTFISRKVRRIARPAYDVINFKRIVPSRALVTYRAPVIYTLNYNGKQKICLLSLPWFYLIKLIAILSSTFYVCEMNKEDIIERSHIKSSKLRSTSVVFNDF